MKAIALRSLLAVVPSLILTVHAAELDDAHCLQCHGDKTLTRSNAAGREVTMFVDAAMIKNSAHSSLACADCHEDLTSDHPDDNKPARVVACASCHESAGGELVASVHSRALTCTECHDGHATTSAAGGKSHAASTDSCSRCHASERINTRFSLPADRVRTFVESYHGLAGRFGSTVAADCASCHGYHGILPSSNTNSTIHASRLVQTCGKCHPGANEKFAQGKIHVDITNGNGSGGIGGHINWWVRRVYLVLIAVVIGAMLAHNGLLFVRKVRAHLRSTGRTVQRMTKSQRWQHAVLALSFIVLAVTGFALKFPDSWLADLLGSSEPLRRWTHRIAGVVLLLAGLYHLIYVVRTRAGRLLVKDLFPRSKDFSDVMQMIRHLAGRRGAKPQIGRFGYAEKMEYWAVLWGTIIMGVTGLMVWFKLDVTRWMPRWAVDVALTIHYYEAILACLAIVVWHFYHVMFDPDVYPLNLACWDGKVSAHWQQEEHPLDKGDLPDGAEFEI